MKPTTGALALVCMIVWLAAAASTGRLGIWLALGGAATGLGATVFVFDPAAVRRSLQPSAGRLLSGIGAGFLMAVATYVLYPVLARVSPAIAADISGLYAAFRTLPPLLAALALLPAVTGEELVWRGAVQAELVRRSGRWPGLLLAALAYALAHSPLGSPMLVAAALLCGLTWGALRLVTGSLVPSLVAHLLWDVLVFLSVPLDGR